MKHYSYYILAALMCCALVCCKEKSNEVIIIGQLEGVEDGGVVALWFFDEDAGGIRQSDTIVNGSFRLSFIDTLNQTKPMVIVVEGEGFQPTVLDLWVAPGAEINITGADKMIRTWRVNSTIPEQIEFNKYKALTEQYERMLQHVWGERTSYYDELNTSPDKWEEYKPKLDSLKEVAASMYTHIMESEIDFMAENKTYSLVWMRRFGESVKALKYAKISDAYIEKMKNLYEGMSDELKSSKQGQSIYVNLYPPTVVKEGDDMADTDFWNLDGELCRLSDYKGKYILLDFWAAGCGPCIMAMPEMKEVSEMYQENLTVVSISIDSKKTWKIISEEKDITWVNLNDFNGFDGIALRYGVTGIPHYVVISPEGKVMTSWAGFREGSLKEKVKEFVK